MLVLPSLVASILPLLVLAYNGEEACEKQGDSFTIGDSLGLTVTLGESGVTFGESGVTLGENGVTFSLNNSLGVTVLTGSVGTTIPDIAGPPVIPPDCDGEFCLRCFL